MSLENKKENEIVSLINKIKVMKSNRFYRLGDLIFKRGFRWKQHREIILDDLQYKDTLLRHYLESLDDPYTSRFDPQLWSGAVKRHARKHKIPSRSKTLVINLRTGDVIATKGPPPWGVHICDNKHGKLLRKMDDIIGKNNISKILIVSAMHYGNRDNGWYNYSEKSFEENKRRLSCLFDKMLNRYNMPLDVQGSDQYHNIQYIDIQILTMLTARHAIVDNGGFGDLIKKFRRIEKKNLAWTLPAGRQPRPPNTV